MSYSAYGVIGNDVKDEAVSNLDVDKQAKYYLQYRFR